MGRPVKVAFASCQPDLIAPFVERFRPIAPDAELYVVSEFPPPVGKWIPYRPDRSFAENAERCRRALAGTSIRFGAILLQPGAPYGPMRWMGFRFAGLRTLFYNANLDHFTLRPNGLPTVARHVFWRLRERVEFETHPGGNLYTWLWRLRHPSHLRRPLSYAAALASVSWKARQKNRTAVVARLPEAALADGISVVIPSRNGRVLLERLLPRIHGRAEEIIIVDNGSNDGTAEWLRSNYPDVRVDVSPEPLSFARAVNRGIRAAGFAKVCLLNNDMLPEPDFFPALAAHFDRVPDLFCATAQIFFPEGKRREETGKAVMRPIPRHRVTTEFPVHCIEPVPGEDGTYVLYGSGGCSLYDTTKLRALGGIDEIYEPAYVEDLDIGVRAWQRGWPTVFAAKARTVHEHRATTSRYYSAADLSRVLERNYLLFITRVVSSPVLFRRLWRDAIIRLNLKAALEHDPAAADVLMSAWRLPALPPADTHEHEQIILALGSGGTAVFPGRAPRREQTVIVASCYIPFPLSHGGAVRMYNLMRRAASEYSQVLITFVDELHTPPDELLDICAEIIQVKRVGSHMRPDTGRPDVVEEFDSAAFRGALQLAVRKWSPAFVQLEFTQMAQYARDCAPSKSILVEHDVTIDLYTQLLATTGEDWEIRRQLERWQRFETQAWRDVDCVVTMSERDRRGITGAKHVATLPNGVDLERFRPSTRDPEPRRLLFIGSFAHLPNLLALDFFLCEVWPRLIEHHPTLHVIAGSRHEYHYIRQRDRIGFALDMRGLEVEGFVSDVRPAYERAEVVIAPLLASAGTNIKIMEAMAMGKAIVSTAGGINGLDELVNGRDVLVGNDSERMAELISGLFLDAERRRTLERNARATAEAVYDWDVIARQQAGLYRKLVTDDHR